MTDTLSCIAKPRQVVQLGSPVFGALAKVLVDRADPVKKGQLVAQLDTTSEEVQVALDRFRASNTATFEAAKVNLAWNQRELERRERLAGNMFTKASDIDEMRTRIEQDKLNVRKAQSDIRTAELEAQKSEAQYTLKQIRSPVDGFVSEVKLSPGEFIYEQTPIMTIVQYDPLAIDLVLPSERYHDVRVGVVAQVHFAIPIDRTVDAQVDAVDPIIDPASDTFRVRLTLPNPGNKILAGVRCDARLPNPQDE